MNRQSKTIYLNFTRLNLPLTLWIAFLIAISLIITSIIIIISYADPSLRGQLVALALLLPLIGMALTFLFLKRQLKRFSHKVTTEAWELMLPEEQKQRLNAQVHELASALNLKGEDLSNLKAAYVLAEDLALRQIEQEKQVSLRRHVRIADAQFDAVFFDKDYSTLVEIAFLVTPSISQKKIDTVLAKVQRALKKFQKIRSDRKVKLLFIIVTQMEPEAEQQLKKSLAERFSKSTVDVDIRLLDFEALQRIYTED